MTNSSRIFIMILMWGYGIYSKTILILLRKEVIFFVSGQGKQDTQQLGGLDIIIRDRKITKLA